MKTIRPFSPTFSPGICSLVFCLAFGLGFSPDVLAQPSEVLMVGHSQVNQQMPGYLGWLMESAGNARTVERQVIGGSNLEESYVLASQFSDTQDINRDPDGKYFYWPGRLSSKGVDPVAYLAAGNVAHLIFTEEHGRAQAQAHDDAFRIKHGVILPDLEVVDPGADWWLNNFFQSTYGLGSGLSFYHQAVSVNPAAQVYLYENFFPVVNGATHCSRLGANQPSKNLAELNAWRKRISAYASAWRGLAGEINERRGQTATGFTYGTTVVPDTLVANGSPVLVIPAAQAFSVLSERVCAGQVGGLTNPNELWADNVHASELANYFVALVMYAVVEGQSPVGISLTGNGLGRGADGSNLGIPDSAVAAAMQQIAWDVVSGTAQATSTEIGTCAGLLNTALPDPQFCGDTEDTETIPNYNNATSTDSPGVLGANDGSLRISKDTTQPTLLDLAWDTGCSTSANDYVIYSGNLGALFDHESVQCSTSGATAFNDLSPDTGDRYFLIVPVSDLAEGSYGQDSNGNQRPQATFPCMDVSSRRTCNP